MSAFAIKICGLKDAEALIATANAGATHAGFNFVRSSPRFITPQKAKGVAGLAPASLLRVAVFADALDHEFEDVVRAIRPQFFQLHGNENPQRVAYIKKRFNVPVIKAVAIATADDLRNGLQTYGEIADELLFDAKTPSGKSGGQGRAFDWSLLTGLEFAKPWMLSGGLTAKNVADAVRISGARGVDVSSGVEVERGIKDTNLINAFIKAAKAALGQSEAA
ncbi:MAG: phosphoribosylanthranilate isomerase [Alphaproteobacteria bacterium]|nr:phosphoribosylanthranilate isomerase [Alphaproteobacteria bacterium]